MAPQHPADASPEPDALAGFVEQGLALLQAGSAGPADTAELQRLLKHENSSTSPARHPVRALVLLPTRELADQVAQQVKLYAK